MEHDLIGRTIGEYHLIDRIGAGGMASVYRAYQAVENRYVAIKVLPIHLAANDTLRQRFMREARTATRLQHPHILPVYDFGEDQNAPYIVMKLVEGGTLDAVIRRGPLPLPMIARVLEQVADALDYAHSRGVIHRDLKPKNILFDSAGSAYLSDFGIARILETTSEGLTGTGGFIGTVMYASPEQCRGEKLTPTSDIYSLGVMLYEMLTGTLPFDGATPMAIMHQHSSEPVPNPLKHRPELPIGITDVIRKALAKLPHVRYQTATALSAAFNDLLRRELGPEALAIHAPPIGPDPVFDTGDYTTPPPIPDALLEAIAPVTPAHTARPAIRPLPKRPPPAPSHPPLDTPDATGDAGLDRRATFYAFLLILVTLFAMVVIALLIISR